MWFAEGLCFASELQVEALQETLHTLGHSDNALLQLTEQKASLQVQLRDVQVCVAQSRSQANCGYSKSLGSVALNLCQEV
jgi:hypothetical protein